MIKTFTENVQLTRTQAKKNLMLSPKTMDKTRLIHLALEIIASAIKQEREIEDVHIRKEEIKLSPLADYVKVCVENAKDFTTRLRTNE